MQQTKIWPDQHASYQGLSSKYFTFIIYLKDISASRKLLAVLYWHCFQRGAVRYVLIERGSVQIASSFNINFIAVELTNVYVICQRQRSYHNHWQVKATPTKP